MCEGVCMCVCVCVCVTSEGEKMVARRCELY